MYVSRKVLIYSLAEGSTFDLPVAERESSRVTELLRRIYIWSIFKDNCTI